MNEDEQAVRHAWRGLGGDQVTIDDVLARYREPHRGYHTVSHVASVLRVIGELLAGFELPLSEATLPRAIGMAAVFHDAVYNPRAVDNEDRSADLAAGACRRLGWAAHDVSEVRRLILATAGHDLGPGDTAAAVLLDADLAVLGELPAVYEAYTIGVRFEYAHLDDGAWRRGRATFLRGFLERDHIYATAVMRHRAEQQARANLGNELAGLQLRE